MLALLRALRLRLAAPEAAESGAADVAAGLNPQPETAAELPAAPPLALPSAHPFRELSAGEVPRPDRDATQATEAGARQGATADRLRRGRA
ncbi:hypothetical protein [Actinoplanes sp. NPDC005259]|uniref:hypothetical protein n=1 Tax=Actinoplanes sp. NPDC005259 TaxID=3154674 RepID=UPI0033A76135